MGKFIVNVLIFVSPLFLLGFSMEILLRNIPNDYAYKKSYLDIHSDDIEVLFLGSSHAYYDINPAYIKSNSFNASFISQSLDNDYEILKKFDGHWGRLKTIAIPISYFSLFYKLETGVESWRVKYYVIYYGMNKAGSVTDYSLLLSDPLDITLEGLKSFYILGHSNIKSSELGWGTNYRSDIKNDLIETGKTAANRHTYPDQTHFSENVNVVKAIIQFADERDIKIVFYTPPAFHTYVENLNKEQLDLTIKTMKQLADSYQNVIYVNFLTDPSFIESDFYDADHLNEIGAEKFTKKMDNLINDLH